MILEDEEKVLKNILSSKDLWGERGKMRERMKMNEWMNENTN